MKLRMIAIQIKILPHHHRKTKAIVVKVAAAAAVVIIVEQKVIYLKHYNVVQENSLQ